MSWSTYLVVGLKTHPCDQGNLGVTRSETKGDAIGLGLRLGSGLSLGRHGGIGLLMGFVCQVDGGLRYGRLEVEDEDSQSLSADGMD